MIRAGIMTNITIPVVKYKDWGIICPVIKNVRIKMIPIAKCLPVSETNRAICSFNDNSDFWIMVSRSKFLNDTLFTNYIRVDMLTLLTYF